MDVRVLGDVAVVVVVNEGVAVDRVVQRQCRYHQQETQNDVSLFGRREKTWRLLRHGCKDLITEDTADAEAFFVTHLFNHVTNVTDHLRASGRTTEDTELCTLMKLAARLILQ